MIAAIVFSRDRAMQLDLLLRSLDVNGANLFSPVYVLFRATTEDHERAYRVLRDEHPDIELIPDGGTSFRVSRRMTWHADYACFFTDDSVLYRPIPKTLPYAAFNKGMLCFSLRLGRNTTYCYPHSREQKVPEFVERDGILTWDWTTADGDFGYPASVDGHVFRGATMGPAIYDCPPDASPNQIEEHLIEALKADGRCLMSSYAQSHLVGLPANIVTETHRNRHGHRVGDYPDALMDAYLRGRRLALRKMDFSDVRGAHQEIPLAFA